MADQHRRDLVNRKLVLLVGYADELAALLEPRQEGPSGNIERRATERLVQLIVEVTVDTNNLLADSAGLPPPPTSRASFEAARTCRAIREELARRFLVSYVGLRNRIVHDYDRLDDRLVVLAARRLVDDAREYGAQVRAYLEGTLSA